VLGLHLLDASEREPPGVTLDWLDADERARYDALADDRARRELLVGRWLVKSLLATVHGVRAPQLTLDARGKPRLAGDGPSFSLAHAGGGFALAVAERAVGVDLEPVRAVSPELREAALDDDERMRVGSDEEFFRAWTAKEAYMKRAGLGLSIAPRSLHVDLGRGELIDGADGSRHAFSWVRWGRFVVSWL
jgi:4'-phosphopantetheinyl transferase